MFYLVGLGLFDEKDISLKGLECLKNVDKIYAEFFTSRLFGSSFEAIENLIGQKIEVLVRNEVEEEHKFIDEAKTQNIALITGGDPLIATTHSDFLVQCSKKDIMRLFMDPLFYLQLRLFPVFRVISLVKLQLSHFRIIIFIQNLLMRLLRKILKWICIL